MIYHEKSEFWHREFLIIQEKINSELRNSVDKRDLNECQLVVWKRWKQANDWILLNKQKPLFKLCF